MIAKQNEIVVSSRVRLARNFCDLPFSNLRNPQNAASCIERTRAAFAKEQPTSRYSFYMLREMSKLDQLSLMEQHLISRDLLENSDVGAALVRSDKQLSIMINEEDHLRIQAMVAGMQLKSAAKLAFQTEEKLQKTCEFCFDPQLGYLTACPTNTGTGMRASLMLHLPMLTAYKQMGNVNQTVAKLGLTIRGLYGEGSEALGDLYQVSNQVTLGRTEEEIIEAVLAVGKQLIDMEQALRAHSSDNDLSLKDRVMRSYGVLQYALCMDDKEFISHWSNLRLGASMALLPVPLKTVDELLNIAQDAHVKKYKHQSGEAISTDQARCLIIKDRLNAPTQEE